MQNKKLIVLIVLGIGAVFSLTYGIVAPSKIRRGVSEKAPSGIKKQAAITPEINPAPPLRPAGKTNFSAWGRDPFSPSPTVPSPTAISAMSLTGILWDDAAPLAVINDNPAAVGDRIGGYTIVEIQRDKIIVTDGARNYELRLSH